MTVSDTLSSRPAGILRRFGAMVYDTFVVAAVLFIAALPLPVLDQLASGEAWALAIKRVYLLGACFAYLGGFWVHGGQTVGMKVWRLRLLRDDGRRLRWKDAFWRFTVSCLSLAALGLGFFWVFVDPHRRTWHDHLSHTYIAKVESS